MKTLKRLFFYSIISVSYSLLENHNFLEETKISNSLYPHFDKELCCNNIFVCKNLGDNKCDQEHNTKECFWDLGDCINDLDKIQSNLFSANFKVFSNFTESEEIIKQIALNTGYDLYYLNSNFIIKDLKSIEGVIYLDRFIEFIIEGELFIRDFSFLPSLHVNITLINQSSLSLKDISIGKESLIASTIIKINDLECKTNLYKSINLNDVQIMIDNCEKVEIHKLEYSGIIFALKIYW